jgi:hypothetical protein
MPTPKGELALHRLARFCSLLLVVSRATGLASLDQSWLWNIASWTEVLMAFKRGRFREAALILSWLPKFRLPWGRKDADRISLLHHIFRFIVHGRSDYKLGEFAQNRIVSATEPLD